MDEPVTVTQAFQVTPGREEEFSEWATGLLNEAAHYVEYLGGGILGAGGTGDDWHVVFRWSNQEAARRWEATPVRSRFAAKAARFAQADKTKRTTGVRAWFDLPSRMATPPPKWKAALVTLAAVFPPVLIFNLTVIPYLGGLSVVLRTLTLCVAVTGVVTWVMMPRLQRLLKNWLNPPPEAEAVDAEAGAAPEAGGRSGTGRRSRRGWSGGDPEDFGYGAGGATAARDLGYGAGAAQPAWLVEVAPRGREEDPGWRDDGWRDVQPGRGPWYASQQQRVEPEPEPEPGPRYRQRAGSGAVYGSEHRAETGPDHGPEPRGWYREQQESGSWYREEPEPGGWDRQQPEPEPRYRDEPEPRYRAEPQPDERYWEHQEPGRWYRERETEILQPVRQDTYEDDEPYYDSRNPPRYSRRRQGYPDDEEDYGEPDWQPGTGRYRR